LFETLEEVGDLPAPKLALFFDEAHLLFNDLPKELLERIETVVRLIRSKGVGAYFVTQNPDDIPESVLSQLGHRVQHALRAFTASDNERIKKISKTFRTSPGLDVQEVITNLATGEALVSGLNEKGEPQPVVRTLIRPPESQIGPIDVATRTEIMSRSMLATKYNQEIDRESAFEVLKKRTEESAAKEEADNKPSFWGSMFGGDSGKSSSKRSRQTAGEAFVKSMVRTIGNQLGREILRGVMGTMSKK
jgi:DNA helicase HerA-like ATPase